MNNDDKKTLLGLGIVGGLLIWGANKIKGVRMNPGKNSKDIITAIENGDSVVLPISQEDLIELGWHFEDDEHFDRFLINMMKGKIRLIGEVQTGYNPGYGIDNHGQGFDYDGGTVVANGEDHFGGKEGLSEFWGLVDANL